jgi:hypothetical protein
MSAAQPKMDPNRHEPDEFAERVARLEADVAQLQRMTKGTLELLAWGAGAALLAVFVIKFDRPGQRWWPQVFDTAHVVLSALVVAVVLRLSRRVLAGFLASPWSHYLVAATVAGVLGGGVEITQRILGRGDPSVADLARDLLGALGALLVALSLDQRGSGSAPRSMWRWALRGAAGLAFCLGLAPTARAVGALVQRHRAFPTLADFESAQERRFVKAGDGAVLTFEAPPREFTKASGRGVAKVGFGSGKYPKLELTDLVGDWSSYQALVFEVYSTESTPVTAQLRVHDRLHHGDLKDRFNTTVLIPPGQTTVSIPLTSIRHGPTRRTMDMSMIEAIILFLDTPPRPVTLYLDNFRLD